jgi:membrane protease YdiL (CAAX protease family)
MRYFRSYPWGLQLFLFLMMVFTMSGFAYAMMLTFLPKLTPFSFIQITEINENSLPALINASIIVQGILNLFIFLVPAFLFSYLTHPNPAAYLGLRAPGKKIQWVLVILIMLGAMPVLEMIGGLISHINFGAKVKAEQAANDSMISAFLNMPSFGAFIRTFTILAIIPAIGEEMFFRGVMLRFAKKRSRNMGLPIIFTALVFSYAHANIYGYLSIFLAGVLLAVIYYLTGSLWCSIIAHLFFNGSQVIIAYIGNTNAALKTFMANNDVPVYLVISGAILFSISFYLLLKNKTPLPENWTDDFTPEELSQQQIS